MTFQHFQSSKHRTMWWMTWFLPCHEPQNSWAKLFCLLLCCPHHNLSFRLPPASYLSCAVFCPRLFPIQAGEGIKIRGPSSTSHYNLLFSNNLSIPQLVGKLHEKSTISGCFNQLLVFHPLVVFFSYKPIFLNLEIDFPTNRTLNWSLRCSLLFIHSPIEEINWFFTVNSAADTSQW